MSAENQNLISSISDGIVASNVSDSNVVNVLDMKNTRNIQTQHGDYRTVDEENTFLIVRCLWPHIPFTYEPPTSVSIAATKPADDDNEQVVWIEPFANEVSVTNWYLLEEKVKTKRKKITRKKLSSSTVTRTSVTEKCKINSFRRLRTRFIYYV